MLATVITRLFVRTYSTLSLMYKLFIASINPDPRLSPYSSISSILSQREKQTPRLHVPKTACIREEKTGGAQITTWYLDFSSNKDPHPSTLDVHSKDREPDTVHIRKYTYTPPVLDPRTKHPRRREEGTPEDEIKERKRYSVYKQRKCSIGKLAICNIAEQKKSRQNSHGARKTRKLCGRKTMPPKGYPTIAVQGSVVVNVCYHQVIKWPTEMCEPK
jgi:hypothetical protein